MEGTEDCLILNLWSPGSGPGGPTHLLPVMLWIHGGFFLFGSGNTEYQTFERFVEQGVIIVTVNYRWAFSASVSRRRMVIWGSAIS